MSPKTEFRGEAWGGPLDGLVLHSYRAILCFPAPLNRIDYVSCLPRPLLAIRPGQPSYVYEWDGARRHWKFLARYE